MKTLTIESEIANKEKTIKVFVDGVKTDLTIVFGRDEKNQDIKDAEIYKFAKDRCKEIGYKIS